MSRHLKKCWLIHGKEAKATKKDNPFSCRKSLVKRFWGQSRSFDFFVSPVHPLGCDGDLLLIHKRTSLISSVEIKSNKTSTQRTLKVNELVNLFFEERKLQPSLFLKNYKCEKDALPYSNFQPLFYLLHILEIGWSK